MTIFNLPKPLWTPSMRAFLSCVAIIKLGEKRMLKKEYKGVLLLSNVNPAVRKCSCGLSKTIDHVDLKSISSDRAKRYAKFERELDNAKRQGKTHKVWVSSTGSNTRGSHIEAHRQRVAIDEYFMVGGERLFLPSDPAAPFAETANCRCHVEFEANTIRDETYSPAILNGVRSSVTISEFLDHYFNGNGESVYVDFSLVDLDDSVLNSGKVQDIIYREIRTQRSSLGQHPFEVRFGEKPDFFNFGRMVYKLVGEITITEHGWTIAGQLRAFDDTYDFQEEGPFVRNVFAEAAVRGFNLYNDIVDRQGIGFSINIVGARPVLLTGSWFELDFPELRTGF